MLFIINFSCILTQTIISKHPHMPGLAETDYISTSLQ